MNPLTWLKKQKGTSSDREALSRGKTLRQGETIEFDVTQIANAFKVEGDGICLDFAVEGIEMPPGADASFAVWALLPRAMEAGFNFQVSRPIDPVVAANAERLSPAFGKCGCQSGIDPQE